MAKKKSGKFHDSGKSIFSSSDSKKPVGSIPIGGTGPYKDTMDYADSVIKKNSNFKKSTD